MSTEQSPRDRGRKTQAERQAYTRRRAQRTAGEASSHRNRWTIDDARTALDVTMSVPEVALRLGRTASAVEGLRAKWRSGALPVALADQLPPYRPADGGLRIDPDLEAGDD